MTEGRKLLVDTDVLIAYLRGHKQAVVFLESLDRRPATSVICVAELFAGARDEREREAIEHFLLAFDLLPVNIDIARRGGAYRQQYVKSHGTGLADALIAATVMLYGLVIATFNARHYPMLKDVLVPYQRE